MCNLNKQIDLNCCLELSKYSNFFPLLLLLLEVVVLFILLVIISNNLVVYSLNKRLTTG